MIMERPQKRMPFGAMKPEKVPAKVSAVAQTPDTRLAKLCDAGLLVSGHSLSR